MGSDSFSATPAPLAARGTQKRGWQAARIPGFPPPPPGHYSLNSREIFIALPDRFGGRAACSGEAAGVRRGGGLCGGRGWAKQPSFGPALRIAGGPWSIQRQRGKSMLESVFFVFFLLRLFLSPIPWLLGFALSSAREGEGGEGKS